MSRLPFDRHHLIPRSRCRLLGIDPDFTGNIQKVRAGKHRAWHRLFGSATPEEAIEIIRTEWSLSEEGQTEFRRLTGNVRLMRRRAK